MPQTREKKISKNNNNMPRKYDVICGKTSTSKHPGNLYFRELVLARVDDYIAAIRKSDKGQIVADILKLLKQHGSRFLKVESHTGTWHLLSAAESREKVSHSMRDRVQERKKGKIIKPNTLILKEPLLSAPLGKTRIGSFTGSAKSKIAVESSAINTKKHSTHAKKHSIPNAKNVVTDHVAADSFSMTLETRSLSSPHPAPEAAWNEINVDGESGAAHNCTLSCSDQDRINSMNAVQHLPQNCKQGGFVFDDTSSCTPSSPMQMLRSEANRIIQFDLSNKLFNDDYDEELCDLFHSIGDVELRTFAISSESVSSEASLTFLDEYNEMFLDDLEPDLEQHQNFVTSSLQEARLCFFD